MFENGVISTCKYISYKIKIAKSVFNLIALTFSATEISSKVGPNFGIDILLIIFSVS